MWTFYPHSRPDRTRPTAKTYTAPGAAHPDLGTFRGGTGGSPSAVAQRPPDSTSSAVRKAPTGAIVAHRQDGGR